MSYPPPGGHPGYPPSNPGYPQEANPAGYPSTGYQPNMPPGASYPSINPSYPVDSVCDLYYKWRKFS